MRPYQACEQRARPAEGRRSSPGRDNAVSSSTGTKPRDTPVKPARVTLNMPPELDRWTSTVAQAIDVPRVSIQDALSAMIRAGMHDKAAEAAVLAQLQQHEAANSMVATPNW